MAENTKIQWADHTFNPWRGCMKVAAGCANCYADMQSKRNPGTLGVWGPNGTRVLASEAMWRQPVKWDREAAQLCEAHGERVAELDMPAPPSRPERPRVFCASLADVFEDWPGVMRDSHGNELTVCRGCGHVSLGSVDCGGGEPLCARAPKPYTLDDARARLFALIDSTPNLDWLLLTKRPENVRRMWTWGWGTAATADASRRYRESIGAPYRTGIGDNARTIPEPDAPCRRSNVWLGTSIACQEDADKNIPELLKCRDLAAKLFVSAEPLAGPVLLDSYAAYRHDPSKLYMDRHWLRDEVDPVTDEVTERRIDWVIVGGESGPHARPCNVEWIRSIVRQCKDAGVPCFVKQLGANPVTEGASRGEYREQDSLRKLGRIRDPKGGDPSEWPECLRVREAPT